MPRWRWQIGGIVLERELAMAHGSAGSGRRPPAARGRPAGAARADAALHLAQRPRRAPRERRTGDRAGRRRLRLRAGAYRVAGAGWQAGGEWYRDVRAREEAARGLSDREDLWAAGTFAAELEPGDCHEVTAAAAPFDGTASRGDRDRRSGAGPRGRARRRRERRGRRAARARRRPVRDHHLRPPDRGRRLPVVRRVVARPDDLLRGPLPRDRSRRRGPRGAAHVGCDRVRGDAREHRRHRLARVQHRRRHALVRPRGRPSRVRHRRRRPRERARAGAGADRPAPRRRHALRHRRRPGRRAAAPGRRRLGADVDGRPRRRRAGHAARGQAGRGERAVAPRARRRGAERVVGAARPGRGVVRGTLRPRRTEAACSTSSTGRAGTTRRCGRTSCSPCRCRDRR